MKRRSFIKKTALSVVAVSITGFVRFNGASYEGDCETTTDILGPFYRPSSPVRDNLVIQGAQGELVQLKGAVKHKDCVTPYKGAQVELWHCSADGVYDNDSDEFRYRGTTFCDEEGRYSFDTVVPVPYEVGDGRVRPAHFHLLISAQGYQSLVTQVYFTDDPHIPNDAFAASPFAQRRILDIERAPNGKQIVTFDVGMTETLRAEPAAIEKLTGLYRDESDTQEVIEFFSKEGQLWMKNEVFGEHFVYIGNNTFEYPGTPPGWSRTLRFKLLDGGSVKLTYTLTYTSSDGEGAKEVRVLLKG